MRRTLAVLLALALLCGAVTALAEPHITTQVQRMLQNTVVGEGTTGLHITQMFNDGDVLLSLDTVAYTLEGKNGEALGVATEARMVPTIVPPGMTAYLLVPFQADASVDEVTDVSRNFNIERNYVDATADLKEEDSSQIITTRNTDDGQTVTRELTITLSNQGDEPITAISGYFLFRLEEEDNDIVIPFDAPSVSLHPGSTITITEPISRFIMGFYDLDDPELTFPFEVTYAAVRDK